MKSDKKPWWQQFQKPRTINEAEKIIRETCLAYFGIAAILFLLGLWILPNGVVDAVLIAFFTCFIMFYRSRLAALLLVLNFLAGIIITGNNMISQSGGGNIVLPIIMAGYSFNTLRATVIYHRLSNSKVLFKNILIINTVSISISVLFLIIEMIIYSFFGDISKLSDLQATTFIIAGFIPGYYLASKGWLPFTKNRRMVAFPIQSTGTDIEPVE